MIEPLFNNVLIEPVKKDKTTASGLFIPETTQETFSQGIVRAVGPECEMLMVLDRVIFPAQHGVSLEHNGNRYSIMAEESVLAVIND